MSKFQFVLHPSMREHVEAMKSAKNLRGQDCMVQQLLLNSEIGYYEGICILHSQQSGLAAFSMGTARGLFAEYPIRTMQALASGKGRTC